MCWAEVVIRIGRPRPPCTDHADGPRTRPTVTSTVTVTAPVTQNGTRSTDDDDYTLRISLVSIADLAAQVGLSVGEARDHDTHSSIQLQSATIDIELVKVVHPPSLHLPPSFATVARELLVHVIVDRVPFCVTAAVTVTVYVTVGRARGPCSSTVVVARVRAASATVIGRGGRRMSFGTISRSAVHARSGLPL